MKKLLPILLICLLALGVLASCVGTNPQETKESVTEKPTESETDHVHAFGDWAVAREATCTEDGSEERVCVCGEKETRKIEAKGHTEVIDQIVEATCTEAGKTEGKHCSVCGEVLVAQLEVPAKGHTETIDVSVEPTCEEGGYTESHCTVCEEKFRKTSDALGHLTAGNRHKGADGKTVVSCVRCLTEVEVTDAERERLAAIAEAILGTRQRIVGYGTPDCNSDYDFLVAQYKRILDIGINTVITNGLETNGGLWNVIDAANETGMDILVDSSATAPIDPETVAAKMLWKEDEPHIVGLYLRDEPYPFWFGNLGKSAELLREQYPNAKWSIGANLLGWGNPAYVWTGVWQDGTQSPTYAKFDENGNAVLDSNGSLMFKDGTTAEAMRVAMESYFETVKPDHFCFDVYPYHNQNNADLPNYLANLAFFQSYALKYDVEMWTFLQTANNPTDGSADPTYEQIRCETNLSLAAGAKTLLCFTVCQTTEWSYMISGDGTLLRPIYYDAQSVFTGIHRMKGVYLDYSFDQYIINSENKKYTSDFEKMELTGMLTDSYDILETADGKEIFVGCGKNAEGKLGLYVVNLNWKQGQEPTVATLTLTEEAAYRLWGDKEGLVGEGVTDRFVLTLESGEGCFIELNPAD